MQIKGDIGMKNVFKVLGVVAFAAILAVSAPVSATEVVDNSLAAVLDNEADAFIKAKDRSLAAVLDDEADAFIKAKDRSLAAMLDDEADKFIKAKASE